MYMGYIQKNPIGLKMVTICKTTAMHSVALEKPDGTDGTWSLGLTASSKIHRSHRKILSVAVSLLKSMGGVFAKYSVQAVAWLFSKKSGLFFGISRFKKIDTVS